MNQKENFMSASMKNKDEEGRIRMTRENNILIKIADILEKENLISIEERNRVVMMIRQEENT